MRIREKIHGFFQKWSKPLLLASALVVASAVYLIWPHTIISGTMGQGAIIKAAIQQSQAYTARHPYPCRQLVNIIVENRTKMLVSYPSLSAFLIFRNNLIDAAKHHTLLGCPTSGLVIANQIANDTSKAITGAKLIPRM